MLLFKSCVFRGRAGEAGGGVISSVVVGVRNCSSSTTIGGIATSNNATGSSCGIATSDNVTGSSCGIATSDNVTGSSCGIAAGNGRNNGRNNGRSSSCYATNGRGGGGEGRGSDMRFSFLARQQQHQQQRCRHQQQQHCRQQHQQQQRCRQQQQQHSRQQQQHYRRHRLLLLLGGGGGPAAASIGLVISNRTDSDETTSTSTTLCSSSTTCADDNNNDASPPPSTDSDNNSSLHEVVGGGGGEEQPPHISPGMSHNSFHPLWRSEQNQPFEKKLEDALIFCGNSNRPLAESVAESLGTKLGRVSVQRFADGEVSMQFLDSLRGKDVYIIQPTAPPVNENLMELLLMISTCRRSSARKITAVIPYYGYARQDRKLSSRVPISAADVARMIECMGVDRVVAVDLHCGQIQGFFGPRVPVDNLEAQLIGLEYFTEEQDLQNPVVVSPDAGGVYRARKFQKGLIARGHKDCGIAMLIKQRPRANEIERMDLVGTVTGSDVVIVDDMIDTAGTLCEAAKELKQRGAKRVFAFATHGLFSGPAVQRINNSALEKVIVTDTLKCRELATAEGEVGKIKRISVAVLLADTIRRLHQKESLHDLFDVKAGN
eukprot:GHVS01106311.1.p1 GENE.GHVS01106311.1~~GHVS01106311.1.p1  ORF type:complete len:602 (-),score=179.11 GHVS01106311.1:750-2555(-)